MRTSVQIKEQIDLDEFYRYRRVLDSLEVLIKENFSSGGICLSGTYIKKEDQESVYKDLRLAGYRVIEKDVVVGGCNLNRTYIYWDIPNE